MKTHGPNSPQSIRGLRERRSLRGLLDTRRMAEADLRVVEYVGAFGKGFHIVKNPGGGESYIVADQTGGRTFAPGTSILLGSPTGLPGEAVLGGAPAGKKGGRSTTHNPRRRGTAATPTNQYAFGINSTSELVALLYADGVYVSTRDSIPEPTETVCGIILTDPLAIVGDGSALLSDGTTTHKVWDVDGLTTYSYTAPGGWALKGFPTFYAGAVYWIEYETGITGHVDGNMNMRLRTADASLASATTVSTIALDATDYDYGNGVDHYHADSFESAVVMADADGAVVYARVRHHEPGHSVSQWQHYQFRITLSSGAEAHREYFADTYHLASISANWCPVGTLAAGSFVSMVDSLTEVYAKTDDASAQATLLYTALGSQAAALNVGPNGSTVQAYTQDGSNEAFWIYRSGSLVTATVQPYDGVNYPLQMFYYGAT